MTRKVSLEIKELQGIIKEISSRAQALIEYVNTLSKETLLAKRITSRADTVMLVHRWITKNQLTLVAQANNAQMIRRIRKTQEAFEGLWNYGVPSLFDERGNLYTWKEYD